MAVTKFAISIPAETMQQVDRAARRLRVTRSRYISMVLARVAQHEHDRTISSKVDQALTEIETQDLDTARHLQRARRDAGTEW